MKSIYQALALDKDEQVEVRLIDDTITGAANTLSTLGFEVRALIWLESAPEGETNRILSQSAANHANAYIKNEPWKWDTKGFDVDASVDTLIDYFGMDKEARRIHAMRGSSLFKIADISLYQAHKVKRRVDKMFNPHDRYCELKYDKATRTAWYDIVS